MVEFLLLTLPMLTLASATLGVTWYSFARAQVTQIANEAALQASEPDVSTSEVFDEVKWKLAKRLGLDDFSMTNSVNDGTSLISIEVPASPGPLSLVLPTLSVVGYVPVQG